MTIKIFDICRKGTHVLGPGNRYIIWVQGCKQYCPYCITPESWALDKGIDLESEDIAADIVLTKGIDGITISGGEPFLQAEALASLLKKVKLHRPEITVIIYTGYSYSELKTIKGAKDLIESSDIIIDGKYIDSLNDNKGIKGSINQKIISISNRLDAYIPEMESGIRKQQYIVNSDGTYSSIGVPLKNQNH
ncbi:MAG: radical SAM protein [Bacteroidetes bacterium]|uniref:Radical SAM protein n=1 Tax=Candidatus Gallipaludibacter merdavium TaxID=2840839 RepID=A0A9D9HUQ6_9BACT|nr:radical SAM protein [Candidatus Gallipaludibacter merdavium]